MDDGRIGKIVRAVRIGIALDKGPLTLYGACLAAEELTDKDWSQLSYSDRNVIRNRTQRLLDCLTPGPIAGKILAEDTQGRTVIYYLIET